MKSFQYLLLGFSTESGAGDVVQALDAHVNSPTGPHMTHLGPRAPDGSRQVKMYGTSTDTADARPGAFVAGVLESPPAAIDDLAKHLAGHGWFKSEPIDWYTHDFKKVLTPDPSLEDIQSLLLFKFDPPTFQADASALRIVLESSGAPDPVIVTNFGLEQPANATAASIAGEVTAATGSPFGVYFNETADSFHIGPEIRDALGIDGGVEVREGIPEESGGPASEPSVPRYIEGRCSKLVKVNDPSWLLVQISVAPPAGGHALLVDLPAAGTRVHAMLHTNAGLELLSEPDLDMVVPRNRDTGWHGWQVRATRPGDHDAVVTFHHDGEALGVLTFGLHAGVSSSSEQIRSTAEIDLRPLKVRQGLLVVRATKGMLHFVAMDGARQGSGVATAARLPLGPAEVARLKDQKKNLDALARGDFRESSQEDAARVRAMGVELFEFLPHEIREFLDQGVDGNRWDSLKIEADTESLAW